MYWLSSDEKSGQKVMRLVLKKFLLTTELQINIIPFKVVPLGSHRPPNTLLPLPVAVLQVFMWKCPRPVCHDILDIVRSSKMATLRWSLAALAVTEFNEM